MLWKGDLQGKVKTELVALTVKSVLTYVLLLYSNLNLLAYTIAQLSYSLILLGMYPLLITIEKPLKDDKTNILPEHKQLVTEFAKSSFLKFFLTEGEKLIMVGT